jgi:predicted acetyltransferase/GNAT superfamily N-acetyltransferase
MVRVTHDEKAPTWTLGWGQAGVMSDLFSTQPWDGGDVGFLWDMLYTSIHVRADAEAPPLSILDEPDIAHYLRDFGTRAGDDAEIATVDGRPVGAAFCRRMPADDPGYGFIAAHIPEVGMAVDARHRGHGVGTHLLGALLERHPTMSLSVDRDNVGAHALYRRLGFVEITDDGHSVTMLHRPPAVSGLELIRPSLDRLDAYADALRSGWSPNTMRPEAAGEALAAIAVSPAGYLATLDDPEAAGPPIPVGDGFVPRIPGTHRWIWDGEFCGGISVRWQPGTPELPPHVLGHIGYSVVPWKQRLGYATRALAMWLDELRAAQSSTAYAAMVLPYVELTTELDNEASQRVIMANAGVEVERFTLPETYGEARSLIRWRIDLR